MLPGGSAAPCTIALPTAVPSAQDSATSNVKYCSLVCRGEIVEDVEPPLPLSTPLLLVKPPVGLSTPEVFKALDLARRSAADPLELLRGLAARGAIEPELCVNDLEQPAFDVLPSLAQLKQRLITESDGRFSAVFMTGARLLIAFEKPREDA